jgi:D-beta-D-heptose 7-phosphate kinase/D-beta-D-heptose 1-phosphate adenosyltransferase
MGDAWREVRGGAGWPAVAALAFLAAFMAAGLFEYNFGDSEILMFTLLVSALPYACDGSARGGRSGMTLSPARARALLKAMRGGRVLVLGDVMLDQFLWGKVARISPEAPVPVVEIASETFHLGGAANVAGNVRALGGQAVVAGIIGDDASGVRVRTALAEAGVEDALSVAGEGRPTTVKTRIIAHHQQVVRADREASTPVAGALERALLQRVRAALPSCGALILSDYHKGVVTPSS